ncbi:MAG: hypothetical protein ACKOF9_08290, partial [Burkholderiales bacterium]
VQATGKASATAAMEGTATVGKVAGPAAQTTSSSRPVGQVLTTEASTGAAAEGAAVDAAKSVQANITPNTGRSIVYVDSNGTAIAAQRGSVFRANAVTPEIDASISKSGFLSGEARGVPANANPALGVEASMADRLVQYVEAKPFPRDTNFVGFKRIPHDALGTAIRTGRSTLKEPGAFVRLDEVNVNGLKSVDVEKLYQAMNRTPVKPIDVVGEVVVEGSVPTSAIVQTHRIGRK